jgi:hypothetical protein
MGLLRRLLGGQPAPDEPAQRTSWIDLGDQRGDPPSGFAIASGPGTEVVGESHYRREADRLVTWVTLVPEPDNPYDANTVSVHIVGRKVGHLARADAAAFAPVLDRLAAAGLVGYGHADIFGGWDRGAGDRGDYGITLYIGSFEWLPEAKRLADAGDEAASEALLLEICAATEAEAAAEGFGAAPAAYERLAILYRKRKDRAAEIAILERYEAAPHAPGVMPGKLAERLAKLRGGPPHRRWAISSRLCERTPRTASHVHARSHPMRRPPMRRPPVALRS